METLVATLRVPTEVAARYDELARQTGRSRNYLMNEALREYLACEQEDLERLRRGVEQADRGELVDQEVVHEETMALLERFGVTREEFEADLPDVERALRVAYMQVD